jgi:hypothetical protein
MMIPQLLFAALTSALVTPECSSAWARMNTTMYQADAAYQIKERQCLTRCIPPRAITGKTCRSICSDGSDRAVIDYVSVCEHNARGKPYFEDFDMTWNTTHKILSTSRARCLPTACMTNANDIPSIATAISKEFCSTMGLYSLESCEVKLVKPN